MPKTPAARQRRGRGPSAYPGGAASGFTLAELLVATMLLSVVMSAVYVLFNSTIGTWRAVDSDYNAYQQGRNTLTMFQREWDNMASLASYLFEGDGDSVTMFLVAEPMEVEDARGPRLMRVQYKFLRGQDIVQREECMVETALPPPPADPQAEVDRSRVKLGHERKFTVCERVKSFRFRYVWVPLPDKPEPKLPPVPAEPVYMETHRQRWNYPQAIEVSLQLEDPKDKKKEIKFKAVIPTRALNFRLRHEDLVKKLREVT